MNFIQASNANLNTGNIEGVNVNNYYISVINNNNINPIQQSMLNKSRNVDNIYKPVDYTGIVMGVGTQNKNNLAKKTVGAGPIAKVLKNDDKKPDPLNIYTSYTNEVLSLNYNNLVGKTKTLSSKNKIQKKNNPVSLIDCNKGINKSKYI